MSENVVLEVRVELIINHRRFALNIHPLFESSFLVRVRGMEAVPSGHHNEVVVLLALSKQTCLFKGNRLDFDVMDFEFIHFFQIFQSFTLGKIVEMIDNVHILRSCEIGYVFEPLFSNITISEDLPHLLQIVNFPEPECYLTKFNL